MYHARTIHPKTVGPSLDTRGTVITLFDHGHQNMLSPVNRGTRGDRRELLPMWEGVTEIFTSDVQPAYGIFPNLVTPLDARGFPILGFWPLAIDRTRLDITWFAADWGDGEMPPSSGRSGTPACTRFDTVMDEDYENLEPIQRSMETAAHGGQVINYQERRIWHVQAWIDKVIGPDAHPRAPAACPTCSPTGSSSPDRSTASSGVRRSADSGGWLGAQVRPAAMNWPVTACWLAWRWSIRRPTAAMCSASPDS